VTFSDALAAVRRWLWVEGVLPAASAAPAVRELPDAVRELLLSAMTPCA
jgi:hypothetical protein